jgi:branched-chain amino acid transport system substrate-binding protein
MLGLTRLARFAAGAIVAAALAFAPSAAPAQGGNPITIGFAMSLTGPLAANGKQALLGMQIWEEEINAKGGLLGRPVKLVYYDDQTNPRPFRASTPSCSTSTRSTSWSARTPPTWRRPPCR